LFHPLNQPPTPCRLKRFILILHCLEHGRWIEGKDYHFRKKLPQKIRLSRAETIDKMGFGIVFSWRSDSYYSLLFHIDKNFYEWVKKYLSGKAYLY
jgi:hypothetical protein